MWFQQITETFFTIALFINAALFIPQAIKLYRKKNSNELSLTTFIGFNFIQLLTVLHGIIYKDYFLIVGYLLSFITCGVVTILIIVYRKPNLT